ncbi:hypothetical protein M8C21_019830 [Ambrosia artemisiifolia]|uniref:Triosephosphate isomerase, chloroplastic n=1 Tax=Ambrosia artemisiifolia TaxID=4212 RepID=A0AAD5BUG0_AMBAR|nr:hypothetical protein M8C21_019830 [Ambrosia artemisiifolia]
MAAMVSTYLTPSSKPSAAASPPQFSGLRRSLSTSHSFFHSVNSHTLRSSNRPSRGIVAMAGSGKVKVDISFILGLAHDYIEFFVGGNWKCNGTKDSIKQLVSDLNSATLEPDVDVVVGPPFVYIDQVKNSLTDRIEIAAQNSWTGKGGAFTGEIRGWGRGDVVATMMAEVEVQACSDEYDGLCGVVAAGLEGTAEGCVCGADGGGNNDRGGGGEGDCGGGGGGGKKAAYALGQDLGVIACIGELLEEREAGKTFDVCFKQLKAYAGMLSWDNIVIAYEPVWAIGTGKVASPEQAQEVHVAVRDWLAKNVSAEVASKTRIIYGGSVNAGNSADLAKKEDIDGFLVGGASLKGADFATIINSVTAKKVAA